MQSSKNAARADVSRRGVFMNKEILKNGNDA
jgi:hypothetical protein